MYILILQDSELPRQNENPVCFLAAVLMLPPFLAQYNISCEWASHFEGLNYLM